VANHKSSVKRAKQTIKKTEQNKMAKSRVKSVVKAVRQAIEAKNTKLAQELLPTAQRYLDRLSKTGVIKDGAAGRKISRLASQVAALLK
jgi:small subunit ribosomal protein S20